MCIINNRLKLNVIFINAGIIFLFSLIFISGCSGSMRYNSVEDNSDDGQKIRYDEEQNDPHKNQNSELVESVTGVASFYAEKFNGRQTASGEIYDMNDLTAAHISYPFNTIIRVTNLKNDLSVEVRINDRMPGFKGRLIDLSLAAAKKIDMIDDGLAQVKIEVLQWGMD